MGSKAPIFYQRAGIVPLLMNLLVFSLFLFGFYWLDRTNYAFYGFFAYFGLIVILRYTVPRHQRLGIYNFKRKKYAEAILEFEKSYDFFVKNRWLDKYRHFLLIGSSRMCFAEMALVNKAFCLIQLDKKSEAIEIYKKAFELYPDCEMASSALKMMG